MVFFILFFFHFWGKIKAGGCDAAQANGRFDRELNLFC